MTIPLGEYWRLLKRYLIPQRAAAVWMAVLLLASIGLQLVGPQAARAFIDAAQTGGSEQTLIQVALLFLTASLVHQITQVLAAYWSEKVAWTATNALRDDMLVHLVRLDLGFHKAHTPGELIERVDGDISTLAGFFSSFVVQLVGSALLLVGVLITIWMVSWQLGLVFVTFAALTLVLLGWVRRFATPYWQESRERSAALYGYLGELLTATEDIRSCGAVPYALRRFYEQLRHQVAIGWQAGFWGQSVWTAVIAAFAIGDVLAYGLGGTLYQTGTISLGMVYMIVAYVTMLARPIDAIRTQLQSLQQADASIVRVRGLLSTRSALTDGTETLPPGALSIAFDHVSFAYNDNNHDPHEMQDTIQLYPEPVEGPIFHPTTAHTERRAPPNRLVLDDLSFSLAPGRTLGLLGRTGSGKTTIARLLFRLYDAQEGAVRLGHIDVRQARLDALRARVGFVTQDVQLFEASLRDNLTFFNPGIPDERLYAVLHELGLNHWLQTLPGGLDSPVSGATLSAGEAQLIALARVFLQDPGLIILDEASSRLDPITGMLLEGALDRLLEGRTAVIIAHRLATIERADDILILEDGQVVEYGMREQLASDPHSQFSTLGRTRLKEVLE